MARQIVVEHDGAESIFDFSKLDRTKLYGQRKRVPLDPDGEPCERADLTSDGAILLRRGMSAQGYFDDAGFWLTDKELVGLDDAGTPLERQDSTLGVAQAAEIVDPSDVLDHQIFNVYMLEEAKVAAPMRELLEAGKLVKIPFVYRGGFHTDYAFVVLNGEGYFAMIGKPATTEWGSHDAVVVNTFDDDLDDDDDLDFEMF